MEPSRFPYGDDVVKSQVACAVLLWLAGTLSSCSTPGHHAEPSADLAVSFELVPVSEVQWDALNPARGDQSPSAGTLYGDRNGPVATGFLFRPVDGFESPPHIHNETYRGVVISGLVHNDDPSAEPMWMPARSFWTQPKGLGHITSARGEDALAYIEIDQGPYLVMPPEEHFASGEEPINVHESNLVWVETASPAAPEGVRVAHLWNDRSHAQVGGTLVKIPAGVSVTVGSSGARLRGVVIAGVPHYARAGQRDSVRVAPGSYFGSQGEASHRLRAGENEAIVYVRTAGPPRLTRGTGHD